MAGTFDLAELQAATCLHLCDLDQNSQTVVYYGFTITYVDHSTACRVRTAKPYIKATNCTVGRILESDERRDDANGNTTNVTESTRNSETQSVELTRR